MTPDDPEQTPTGRDRDSAAERRDRDSTPERRDRDSTPERRDRDAEGRARNARPRDAAGRPLPHGAEGVDRVPEDVALPPDESLVEAERFLTAGQPFHAHEVLEGTWKAAPAEERALWRGLAQVAVGLTHAQRGNAVGAPRLLRRGADQVAPYADAPPHGVDVAHVVAEAHRLADLVEAQGTDAVTSDARAFRLRAS